MPKRMQHLQRASLPNAALQACLEQLGTNIATKDATERLNRALVENMRTLLLLLVHWGDDPLTPLWACFAEGDEILVVMADDNLTPPARSHVAPILVVLADNVSVVKEMEAASIRRDYSTLKNHLAILIFRELMKLQKVV